MTWSNQMVLWPAVTLLGFLLLTALVIALGTQSTARYEAEKQQSELPRGRHTAADAVGATAVL
jgi:hypothetical protein